MAVPDHILQILHEAYQECSRLMPIKACWLYGSYARGDYDSESDVDILMCVNVSDEELRKYRNSVAAINSRLSLDFDVTVSITLKTTKNFLQYSSYVPYYQNIVQEGLLYAG